MLWCNATWVDAHQATERFIPIGRSPGVSNKLTDIGEIVAVDSRQRTITLRKPTGAGTVSLPDDTKIWLDRSAQKRASQTGAFADLRIGRTVEVKYRDAATRRSAEWVKIEVSGP